MQKIRAPAKVNIFLEVGKKEEFLHPICSLVDIISLCDYIYIKPSEKTEVEIVSKWKISEENTVSKLVSLLKKNFNFEAEIKIEKHIPPGSGLGGGSSDAAFVLIYLNKLFNLGLKIEDMVKIAKQIGSDVPLFLYKKRCIIKNYGEKVIPCDDFKLYYLILIPNFQISTKEVYNKLDELGEYGCLTDCEERIRILLEEIKNGDIKKVKDNMFNRLEKSCFEINRQIKEVRYEIEKKTGERFFLSGSGGSLFSIFKEKEEVAKIEKKIILLEGWKKLRAESIKFSM
ncbi:MAG: 4-(cytidine 5'-diphospho)-2-C-methyl-D-erythritol kinase [Candidatus Omnitrophica bacterium]|nr:4-(cytidine 5'-diphospho)-2-C-methyl-D-erythritol kinase [Candidatus Omnitrophota bacterium]